MKYIVYVHTTPSGKKYVGLTKQSPEQRWRNGAGYKDNQPFFRAIKKYGWENIKHEIVKDGLSFDEAAKLEKQLISDLVTRDKRYGYNVCFGGEDGWCGVRHTAEARRKMSEAKIGKPSSRKGVKLSEETRQKLSESHRGKYRGVLVVPKEQKRQHDENGKIVFSEQHRTKISEALKGICRSAEVREHMSKAQTKTKKPVRCIDTSEEFESETAAGKRFNIDKTLIGRVCKGKNKTAKGLRFEYIMEEKKNV